MDSALLAMGGPWLWTGFAIFILVMLTLDLGVFHRKAHAIGVREAFGWSIFWISLALLFNVFVYYEYGSDKAMEFLTGYLIEESLSVDNLFVFLVILSYFSVPPSYQHRVLFFGILGAMVFRAIFIFAGVGLLTLFDWMIYVFGGILVLTALKLLFQEESHFQPERSPMFRLFRWIVPCVSDYRGTRFVVRENGHWFATPLLLVLVVIESADIVFAVDSIPAILAVTRDPIIVYTSNIFAILGLRALFFLLAGLLGKVHYLKIGLAFVLAFVGVKMLVSDVWKIPIHISLIVIAGLLVVAVVASLARFYLVGPDEVDEVSVPAAGAPDDTEDCVATEPPANT
jgi:tellurite resistance protein TerC